MMIPNKSSHALCRFTKDLSDPTSASELLINQMEIIFTFFITPALVTIGLSGNLIFLLAVFRVKAMRTNLNVFVSHLAVADIGFLVSNVFWNVIGRSFSPIRFDMQFFRFPIQQVSCALIPFCLKVWVTASLGFITFISHERYLATCKPLKYRIRNSRRHGNKTSIFIWIVAIAVSVVTSTMLVIQPVRYCLGWPESSKYQHLPDVANLCTFQNKVGGIVSGFLTLLIFLIALAINSILFLLTIISLLRRRVNNNQVETTKRQVTRTLVINGIVFFICQTPLCLFQVDIIFDGVGSEFDLLKKNAILFNAVGALFAVIISCINPYLFLACSSHYRHAMLDAFKILKVLNCMRAP